MKLKYLLMAAGTILTLCVGCVDPAYNLDNIKLEGVILRNLEFPVGSFEEITLETILKAQGASMITLQPGTYRLSGSARITGLNFQMDSQVYFKEAELHTVILNTLPLDLQCSVRALDAEGNPCNDIKVSILSDKTPMIASGRKGSPSENPVIIRLECPDRYVTLEALELDFSGHTGAGFEGDAPANNEGITQTKVSLKMPEGLELNM